VGELEKLKSQGKVPEDVVRDQVRVDDRKGRYHVLVG